jgi:cytoskeleton protein RodZ
MRRAKAVDHDPAESLMRELGAQLRQERLKRGEDLDDVAQHLRIKSSYLFALEQGDLSGLPGRAYALGFLRSYADYLGFDGEDLISRIKSTVDNLTDRTRLRVRTPAPETRLPKTPVVVMSLAVIAGIYAGWAYLNRTSRVMVETVAEVPDDLRARSAQPLPEVADEGSPAADPTAERAPDGAAADVTPTADLEPEPPLPGTTGDSEPPPSAEPPQATPGPLVPEAGPWLDQPGSVPGVVPPETLAAQPAAGSVPAASAQAAAQTDPQANEQPGTGAASAATAGAGSDALALADPTAEDVQTSREHEAMVETRVILRAREEAWIQISSPSGDYAFTRTLEPGEVVTVPNRADLVLWTGNAGGLDIIVDGTPVPVLADAGSGSVRRNVSLDPERLLQAARQR